MLIIKQIFDLPIKEYYNASDAKASYLLFD